MKKVIGLLLLVLLAGCGSNPMIVAPTQVMQAPAADKAQLVFLRSSFVGSAISASIYDVTDGEPKFLGILNNGTKIATSVEPGEHLFMVVSEAADFMAANLEAGETYYAIATPRMGAWKARFSLWPIKADAQADYSSASEEFKEWKTGTTLVEMSDAAMAWYEANKASVVEKQQYHMQTWQDKSPEDLARRTLQPSDGF